MQQSNLEFVLKNLHSVWGEWKAVGDASGVPAKTIEKIARGYTTNPRFDTVDKLFRYFQNNPPKTVRVARTQLRNNAA